MPLTNIEDIRPFAQRSSPNRIMGEGEVDQLLPPRTAVELAGVAMMSMESPTEVPPDPRSSLLKSLISRPTRILQAHFFRRRYPTNGRRKGCSPAAWRLKDYTDYRNDTSRVSDTREIAVPPMRATSPIKGSLKAKSPSCVMWSALCKHLSLRLVARPAASMRLGRPYFDDHTMALRIAPGLRALLFVHTNF